MIGLSLSEADKIPFFTEFLRREEWGERRRTDLIRAVQKRGGKATYVALGCDAKASFHNGAYDLDESVLLPGTDLFVNLQKRLCELREEGNRRDLG